MASTLEIMNAAQLAFLLNKPSAFLYQATSQSIPSGAYTNLTFDTAAIDNWGGWSSSDTTRYTVQVAGVYEVGSVSYWPSGTSAQRIMRVLQNGSQVNGGQSEIPGLTGSYAYTLDSPICEVKCAVGDYLQVAVYQASGAAISTNATAPAYSSMFVKFVRFS